MTNSSTLKSKKDINKELPPFSLIIPAYNESNGIEFTLKQIQKIQKKYDFEILIIDDGSTDDTISFTKSFDMKVISHTNNKGYGAALKTGIQNATHEIICITDADGTYPNEMIPQLVEKCIIEKQDMVIGERTGAKVAISKNRRFAKWGLKKLANWITGEKISDLNSGLRVFTRDAVLYFINILPDGFSFTTTITLGMLVNNYKVDFVPIDYHQRKGKSKIRPIHDTLNFIQIILRIGLYFAPLKIFLGLSIILFIIAIIWGTISTLILGQFADTSTTIIIMSSLQIAALGFLAELINHRTSNYYKRER